MAKQVVKQATVIVGPLEIAANLKGASFDASAAEVDVTNLAGSGWKEFLQGSKEADWTFDGFAEAAGSAGDPDATLNTLLTGGAATPALLSLERPLVDGSTGWIHQIVAAKLSNMVKVGEVWAFNMTAKGTGSGVRGFVVETVTRGATGTSADSITLPAVGASEKLYYAAFVTAASGTLPTLDLVIESDANDTFGSPTTRATLAQFTTTGAVFGSVAGAITDVEYRVSATVGGTSPSFTYVVFLGVAP